VQCLWLDSCTNKMHNPGYSLMGIPVSNLYALRISHLLRTVYRRIQETFDVTRQVAVQSTVLYSRQCDKPNLYSTSLLEEA
jgi:hypothetical protein